MRILWVKAGKLLPVDTGGRIRSYNILRHLAARHDTTLLSYYAGARDEQYEQELLRRFPNAVPLATGGPDGGWAQLVDYARRLPAPAPYAVEKFSHRRVRARVAELIGERRIDVAVCDFLSASRNFLDPLAVPSLLFQHNVESALWDRQALHERNPLKRAAFTIEAKKMRRYERAAVRRFHRVVAVSENDRELMSRMTDPARITVVPTGVDVEAHRPAVTAEPKEPLVLFLGSMDWEANIDGVDYFVREVWPRILQAVPEARFRIVGRNPHARIRQLASPSIDVAGGVPSVIPHLADAAAFVVPLRIGGGTRLKIYEAMAAGRAIISTTVGAEGLDVSPGQDILIEDEPTAFADAVIRVLRNADVRRDLARAALATANRFDWSEVTTRFEGVLHDTIGAAAGSRSAQPLAALA